MYLYLYLVSRFWISRQFGFREGVSTDQIITQLVDKIHLNTKPESKFVTLAALDIKKAFDCVHHETLLAKLAKKFNFDCSAISLIENYLTNRKQSMRVNGSTSPSQNIATGVPQGSVAGPILFIMFINDLMEIDNSNCFADDCLLLTFADSPEKSAELMENTIKSASAWYHYASLNPGKSLEKTGKMNGFFQVFSRAIPGAFQANST